MNYPPAELGLVWSRWTGRGFWVWYH